VMLADDLGVRRSLAALGRASTPREASALAVRWRPWRSYAVLHLWSVPHAPARGRRELPTRRKVTTR